MCKRAILLRLFLPDYYFIYKSFVIIYVSNNYFGKKLFEILIQNDNYVDIFIDTVQQTPYKY